MGIVVDIKMNLREDFILFIFFDLIIGRVVCSILTIDPRWFSFRFWIFKDFLEPFFVTF